jgi:excisionase family DNA binding protein
MSGADRITATNSSKELDSLLDARDAALLLKIHPATLTRLARRKEIPAIHIGRLWRFRKSDLDAWLTSKVRSEYSSFRQLETENLS